MELRRALLLFAIVLGLAAIASSLSRPQPQEDRRTAAAPQPRERPTPTAAPAPASAKGPPTAIAFEADLQPETRRVPPDRATTVTVTAYEAGLVEIEELGLSEPAEPNGPARLDLLSGSAETYAVTFTPLDGGEQRKIGVIAVAGR